MVMGLFITHLSAIDAENFTSKSSNVSQLHRGACS